MNNKWKRWVVGGLGVVLAGTVAVGTVTTTFANSQSLVTMEGRGSRGPGGIGHSASLTTIAETLNMTEADLRTAIQAGQTVADLATEKGIALQTIVDALLAEHKSLLAQAVTDGRLTQEQADARLAELATQLPTQLSTTFTPGGRGGERGMAAASITTIATALGITESDLRSAFEAGKSVADVATEQNVDLDTVIAAIVAEQTTALQQAVTDGSLTQAQADQRLAMLKANLPHLLSLKGGMGHGFDGSGGRGRFGDERGQQRAPSPLATPSQQENSTPVLPSDNSNV